MKAKATKHFEHYTDKTVGRVRREGEIFEVDEGRAELLERMGLIEIVERIRTESLEKREKKKTVR